ncbi:MAG TPA: 2Fe-2S iron-sulfur cluster-binding protein [Vicinamibacterales bacterium]
MATITLAGSGQVFTCDAHDTITRAALRSGIGLPYECNTGSCGTCKIELVSGEIVSRRPDSEALTDRDRARRRVLGCQAVPQTDCMIKARIDEVPPPIVPAVQAATLILTAPLTHDMREFRFELRRQSPFLPGQYALLYLDGLGAPRAYSMSNAGDGTRWDFIVKRVPGGAGSSALFELPIGSTITIDGPYGHAYLRESVERDMVCIAGGSGLGPALSIARGASASPGLAARRLYFFYGGRGRRDLAGRADLEALAPLSGRADYIPVLSAAADHGDQDWPGLTGMVHEAVAATLSQPLSAYEYYFAGPPAMTLATQRMLLEERVPLSQLHFDQFF